MTENGRTTIYGYDLNGNIAQKTLPNGDKETTLFDALNRTTSQVAVSGANQPLYSYAYGHDLAGNVTSVAENYPGGLNNRTVTNVYDSINRLVTEAVSGSASLTTTYGYDNGNNRTSKVLTGGTAAATTSYIYNTLNQLTSYSDGTRNVTLGYDAAGNRASRVVASGANAGVDSYGYDFENRLISLVKGTGTGTGTYAYGYDYRTRRVLRDETGAGGVVTKAVFSGGVSVQEYVNGSTYAAVEYLRGSDYGGGVGGILYTLRGTEASYTHENRRGDVVAKTNSGGALTYQAAYEAYGTRTQESGSTQDRQKGNSKDEDPWGAKNEGQREYDLEADVFLTADPAGMVDGPNLYTYVKQNPWTYFDPEGLFMGYDTAGEYFHEVGQMWKGYGEAGKDAVVGTYQAARHPIDTVTGVAHAVAHPVDTANAISKGVSDTWNSGTEGKGKIIGGVLIAVGTAVAPAAEASNVAKIEKLAEVTNVENKVAAAAKIEQSAEETTKLYRGVPGNGTEKARLAEQGIAKPRGTALDDASLRAHVLGEDANAGVTSWTPDRSVAKDFSGPNGKILEVNKSAVSDKVVPRPDVGKYGAEKEVLLKGTVQAKPTQP